METENKLVFAQVGKGMGWNFDSKEISKSINKSNIEKARLQLQNNSPGVYYGEVRGEAAKALFEDFHKKK